MFKKNISISSTHQLSGKDGKELRRSVLKVDIRPAPAQSTRASPALLPAAAHRCLTNATALTFSTPCACLQAFPGLDEEQLGALLPGKGGLVQTKLSNRCLLYSLDGGNPLFFDPDGRGNLLPTVGALRWHACVRWWVTLTEEWYGTAVGSRGAVHGCCDSGMHYGGVHGGVGGARP